MPTKPLDRLMFAQGALCFFCKKPLAKTEASVEHLVASANGGSNNDENCVACCKAVNALLGSMSLKEKIQVVLNQKGQFKCPNGARSSKAAAKPDTARRVSDAVETKEKRIKQIVANLKQRGDQKPRNVPALKRTIASLFPGGLPDPELTALVQELESLGKVHISETKVTYAL
jgi:hypothetical protein